MKYIGRFAPSPTGLLHIGSLLTAVASYADARFHSGKWLLRMEDLDPPREMQGAADNILFTLEKFGFEWDGEVAYQSQRHAFYRDALDDLRTRNLVYPCDCSRKDWHEKARLGADGFVYNGACANKNIFRQPENLQHGACAFLMKSLNSMMKLLGIMPKIWRMILAILCCCERTVFGHTNWRWWWTMLRKASRILYAVKICWCPRHAKFICNAA